jgi:hypothetical protein
LYDYKVRFNPQGNFDVEVFVVATENNQFLSKYQFTFKNHPTPKEIVHYVKLLECCIMVTSEEIEYYEQLAKECLEASNKTTEKVATCYRCED